METRNWNQETSMIASSDFYQVLRLVSQLAESEPQHIKYKSSHDYTFPHVDAIVYNSDKSVIVTQSFLSLLGAHGILPDHFTEYVQQQINLKNYALEDFINMFDETLLKLFYSAWERSNYYINYERKFANKDFTLNFIKSLLGLDLSFHHENSNLLELFLYHCGILSHSTKTTAGLEAMLNTYFDYPIRIEELSGHWVTIDKNEQSQIGHPQQFNSLGINCMLGNRVWYLQNSFNIIIGAIDYSELTSIFPDQPKLKTLIDIIKSYVGIDYEFQLKVIVNYKTIPLTQLNSTAHKGSGCQLGWNSWLKSRARFKNTSIIGVTSHFSPLVHHYEEI